MSLIKHCKCILCIVMMLFIASCSSMKPIDNGLSPEQVVKEINPGDEIIVHTNDSEKHLIVVEYINKNEIGGNGKSFQYDNVAEIQKKGIDGLKTTGAVVLSLLGYVLIGGLLLLAAL